MCGRGGRARRWSRRGAGPGEPQFVVAGVSDLPPWERVLSKGESTTFWGSVYRPISLFHYRLCGAGNLFTSLIWPTTFGWEAIVLACFGSPKHRIGLCSLGPWVGDCALVQITGLHFRSIGIRCRKCMGEVDGQSTLGGVGCLSFFLPGENLPRPEFAPVRFCPGAFLAVRLAANAMSPGEIWLASFAPIGGPTVF
jgi:hypothetical protein